MSYVNDKQIIYSMHKVGKVYKQKHVLKDISLSYFYGAKIGVLGLNGSGKSTLLRIMAGIDKDHLGETTISKNYTVGYLEQDPQLDPNKTVREIVQEGAQAASELGIPQSVGQATQGNIVKFLERALAGSSKQELEQSQQELLRH